MPAWSQTRLLITLAVAALIVMEPVSWMTAWIPPCIVNPENYAAYYAGHDYCPAFHVFLFKLVARVFEHFGDPNWVVADFTAILALSTIILWIVTLQASLRQSRDMEASIGVASRAAGAAEKAADAATRSADAAICVKIARVYLKAAELYDPGPPYGPPGLSKRRLARGFLPKTLKLDSYSTIWERRLLASRAFASNTLLHLACLNCLPMSVSYRL